MRVVRFILFAFLVIAVAAAAFVSWAWHSEIPEARASAPASFDPAVVTRGGRLAAMGNCISCHTREDGRPYAGGRPLQTPFGTIYATNITPDPETGIGTWSEEAFLRAMREGVDRRGRHLYPAFPYDHFTKVTAGDLRAIYAFIMTREPVRAETPPNELPFPLNVRMTVAGWKLVFLRQGEIVPNRDKNATWNRGAYLVEGLGHCGACHTPRNWLGGEKRRQPFAGGQSEDWHAPALDAASPAPVAWTVEALTNYLRTGRDASHGAAAGPMAPVVENLARATDDDIRAIATYVASFSQPVPERKPSIRQAEDAGAEQQRGTVGQASDAANQTTESIYAGACGTCHDTGRALDLKLSTAVNAPDPRNLLHLILDGVKPLSTHPGVFMPGFADTLTDEQIAALAAHLRERFGQKPAWASLRETLATLRWKKGGAS
jgi:mono/diheme cytochrome c family protein